VIYSGAIDMLMNKRDVAGAADFVRQKVQELVDGRVKLSQLTITKSLRAEYKAVPAHKVLADRIGKRDPGNKPASNDRIPFVYVMPPRGRKRDDVPQGERIETPAFLRENALQPDYIHYITNQIAKPVAQVFGLVVDQLPGYKPHHLAAIQQRKKDPAEAREVLAEELLFGDLLREAERKAAGQAAVAAAPLTAALFALTGGKTKWPGWCKARGRGAQWRRRCACRRAQRSETEALVQRVTSARRCLSGARPRP
jgi:hypothetical protein